MLRSERTASITITSPMETDAAMGRCRKAKRYEWIGTVLGFGIIDRDAPSLATANRNLPIPTQGHQA